MSVLAVFALLDLTYYSHNRITAQSVKEALDLLPSGVCYYDQSGRILLVNQRMNDIHHDLTGHTALNGLEFRKLLDEKQEQGEAIVQMADGRAYSFGRKEIRLAGEPVTELIASDITEEFRLSEKLSRDNERLRQQGEHLRQVGELVGALTIEKEMLNAKIRIHDNLGNGLILAKRYFQTGSEQDREALTDVWNQNIRLLRREQEPVQTGDYHAILKAARDVGVTIRIDGSLPGDEVGRRLVMAAMDECITNTFRHARGDTLFIRVRGKITFTNNGIRPSEPIQETGGLKNLRQLVETAGGEMNVRSDPAFALELTLPQTGNQT